MNLPRRISSWLRQNGRDTFRSVDFILGVVLGVGVAVAAGASGAVRSYLNAILFGELAVGVALLSVVLASLAILVVLIDDHYRRLLEHVGGVPGAMVPYKTVAILATCASVTALIGLVAVAVAPWWAVAIAFGIPTLFTVWSIVGTAQLTIITAGHVEDKAHLFGIPDAVTREVQQKRGA